MQTGSFRTSELFEEDDWTSNSSFDYSKELDSVLDHRFRTVEDTQGVRVSRFSASEESISFGSSAVSQVAYCEDFSVALTFDASNFTIMKAWQDLYDWAELKRGIISGTSSYQRFNGVISTLNLIKFGCCEEQQYKETLSILKQLSLFKELVDTTEAKPRFLQRKSQYNQILKDISIDRDKLIQNINDAKPKKKKR